MKHITILVGIVLTLSLSGCASFWNDPDTIDAFRIMYVPSTVILPGGGVGTAIVPMHY